MEGGGEEEEEEAEAGELPDRVGTPLSLETGSSLSPSPGPGLPPFLLLLRMLGSREQARSSSDGSGGRVAQALPLVGEALALELDQVVQIADVEQDTWVK